jgi:class 3 adenylate cyclase
VRQCPACGESNPDRARFCSSCAAPLAGPSAAREVRKTVTVVFSDLSGSTALGERLDPETLRDIMSRYFDEMSAVLRRHGGTVEKFIGDAIMAVFGIPQLHEDDALRAVRAANEMRERLAVLNAELQRDWAVTLAVRTGVNTGEVVAGDPTTGQRLVTGDTVNVAARLEQAASAGEILLGEGTYRLVRGAVEAEAVAPLALKGKSATVKAHRLVRVISGARGRAQRLDSPMVGRSHERDLLQENFTRVRADGAGRMVTILGTAGVGKSRLVAEFLAGVAGSAMVLQGRCLHYGEGITYWPVLEAVRTALAIADGDAAPEQRRKIAAALEGASDAAAVAIRIADLLGVAQGAAVKKEETLWSVRRLFETLARRRPLVLHFDDLQWAEPTFLDLVEHIARQANAPILVVAVARPELLEHRPGWGGEESRGTTISLDALNESDSSHLIANLLGSARLAPQAEARIAKAAEGNPLFVEEMLAMLIDDGLLRYSDGHWLPTQDLSAIAVPESIHALLAARLDRLGPDERVTLEGGSVEGQVFHGGAVRELSDEDLRPGTGPSLLALARKQLIGSDHSSFAGDEAYRFRHILIRDAAYEGMPKKVRAALHERFAAWLERVAAERVVEFEEIIGYHLERSCLLRAELGAARHAIEDVALRAAAHLQSSGGRAYARGDMPAAVNLMHRAAQLGAQDRARVSLLIDLARGYNELGKFDAAEEALAQAIATARTLGDAGLEERAVLMRLYIGLFVDPTGDLESVRERARRAVAVSSDARDVRAMGFSLGLFGIVTYFMGHAAEGEAALRQAIAHARTANDGPTELDSLGFLPIVIAYGPTSVSRALELCGEMHSDTARLSAGWIIEQEAHLWAMRGDLVRARAGVAEANAIYRDLGMTLSVAAGAQTRASIEMLAGDPAAAERILSVGEAALLALGESGSRSTVAAQRAEALYRLGRFEESLAAATISETLAWPDDRFSQIVLRNARGKSIARLGQPEEGERICRESLAMIQATDFINMHGDTLVSLADVLRLSRKDAEATTLLQEALALYERKENAVSARSVRALLA